MNVYIVAKLKPFLLLTISTRRM